MLLAPFVEALTHPAAGRDHIQGGRFAEAPGGPHRLGRLPGMDRTEEERDSSLDGQPEFAAGRVTVDGQGARLAREGGDPGGQPRQSLPPRVDQGLVGPDDDDSGPRDGCGIDREPPRSGRPGAKPVFSSPVVPRDETWWASGGRRPSVPGSVPGWQRGVARAWCCRSPRPPGPDRRATAPRASSPRSSAASADVGPQGGVGAATDWSAAADRSSEGGRRSIEPPAGSERRTKAAARRSRLRHRRGSRPRSGR